MDEILRNLAITLWYIVLFTFQHPLFNPLPPSSRRILF